MGKCLNCGEKLYHSKLLGSNLPLNEPSLFKLNDFLPEKMRREGFCKSCVYTPIDGDSKLSIQYERYIEQVEQKRQHLEHSINAIEDEYIKRQKDLFIEMDFEVKLFGGYVDNARHLELVESFVVLDSGMWSTSSDNLDAMWSAVHDYVARRGLQTKNKVSDGLNLVKEQLKIIAFMKGANAVSEVKHTFSELAGNGKILIHCQGNACVVEGVNKPADFSEIDQWYEASSENIHEENERLVSILAEKPLYKLKHLITQLEYEKTI